MELHTAKLHWFSLSFFFSFPFMQFFHFVFIESIVKVFEKQFLTIQTEIRHWLTNQWISLKIFIITQRMRIQVIVYKMACVSSHKLTEIQNIKIETIEWHDADWTHFERIRMIYITMNAKEWLQINGVAVVVNIICMQHCCGIVCQTANEKLNETRFTYI